MNVISSLWLCAGLIGSYVTVNMFFILKLMKKEQAPVSHKRYLLTGAILNMLISAFMLYKGMDMCFDPSSILFKPVLPIVYILLTIIGFCILTYIFYIKKK